MGDAERHRHLFELMPQAVIWISPEAVITDANTAAARLLGVPLGALVGTSVRDTRWCTLRADGSPFPPEEYPVIRVFDTGRAVENTVMGVHVPAEGITRWLLVSVVPLLPPGGGPPVEAFATLEDITLLRRSEEYFRSLIEHASDMITVLDADGRLVYESPSNARHLGYGPAELLGRALVELVHPEDRAAIAAAFVEMAARPGESFRNEFRFLARSGEWRHLEVTTRNLLHVPAVNGIVVNARDITQRRRLEAELLRSQKMEAVGRLAGGITHDFNNLLTTVEGNALLLLDRIGPDGDGVGELHDIVSAAQRATALTRSLLAISRNQAVHATTVNANGVVLEMQSMLRRTIPENITLVTMLCPTPCQVRLGEGQFEQIVLNLVLNARDALPEGGRIEIQTTVEAAPTIGAGDEPTGDFVVLSVRDNGTGMDQATSARVFEPFFTTKATGYGTGLGMPTVFGIATQAGGSVEVDSAPGKGTIVTVRLPQLAPAPPPAAEPPKPDTARSAQRRGETILLVEDESAVRGLARRILQRLGYTVLEAEDGEAALRMMRAHRGTIDLVLTDLVMPGLGGIELARHVVVERPKTRILFMSGYSADAIEGQAPPGATLIEKPFTPDMLAGRVRQALEL